MIAAAIRRVDGWLSARLPRLARALLLMQACGFVFCVAGTHGAFTPMPVPPTTTDFASFQAAGRLADLGRASSAYDPVAHRRSEEALVATGVEEKRFLNPPVFLLVCAPLARLPYLPAFVVFEALTGLVWLALATRIAGGGQVAAMCLASLPAVWWALGWGQNSFLSAGLMAGGTLLLRRRPWLAGALLGALCFKPHFGVLVPVALLAGRHWRAAAGAALVVTALVALSAACFGLASWQAFLAMARAAMESGIQLSGHVDPGGAARLAGVPTGTSWAMQAAAAAAAALCVGWAWRGRPRVADDVAGQATANAILVAATLCAMPFVLFYDLVMLGVAAAWLARAARDGGWAPGEPVGLAAAWLFSLAAYPMAAGLHLAVGVLAAPLVLCAAVSRRYRQDRQALNRLQMAVCKDAADAPAACGQIVT